VVNASTFAKNHVIIKTKLPLKLKKLTEKIERLKVKVICVVSALVSDQTTAVIG